MPSFSFGITESRCIIMMFKLNLEPLPLEIRDHRVYLIDDFLGDPLLIGSDCPCNSAILGENIVSLSALDDRNGADKVQLLLVELLFDVLDSLVDSDSTFHGVLDQLWGASVTFGSNDIDLQSHALTHNRTFFDKYLPWQFTWPVVEPINLINSFQSPFFNHQLGSRLWALLAGLEQQPHNLILRNIINQAQILPSKGKKTYNMPIMPAHMRELIILRLMFQMRVVLGHGQSIHVCPDGNNPLLPLCGFLPPDIHYHPCDGHLLDRLLLDPDRCQKVDDPVLRLELLESSFRVLVDLLPQRHQPFNRIPSLHSTIIFYYPASHHYLY